MLLDVVHGIPPLTKAQFCLMVLLSFLVHTEVITKYDLYFNTQKIFRELQFWRLITSVFFIGQLNILALIKIAIFLQFSISLEKGFKRGSIDYLYFCFLTMGALFLSAIFFKMYSLNSIYTFVLYYLQGKRQRHMLFIVNFIPMRASYLVWYITFTNWVVNKTDITENLLGILIGHTFYYFTHISTQLPFNSKVSWLETPQGFARLFSRFFNPQHRQNVADIIPQEDQQQNN